MNDTTENLPAVEVAERAFELAQRKAKALSQTDFVPTAYKNSTANCLLALEIAERLRFHPMEVMQNLYVVSGKPAWSAQFLIALVNASGAFDRLRFEYVGTEGRDDYGCYAVATERGTDRELTGSTVTIAMAKKEGWMGRSGSKWQSMPDQMLKYRAASFWQRTYAPELALGIQTADELRDVIDVTPGADLETLNAEIAAKVPDRLERMHIPAAANDAEKWPQHLPESDTWIDAAGAMYDPLKHGWSRDHSRPAITGSGVFRARRQVVKESDTEQPPETAPETPGDAAQATNGGEGGNGAPPMPATPSGELLALVNALDQSVNAADVARIENHPAANELSDVERDILRERCRWQGQRLASN